jgi:hypothetical protein
MQTSVQRPWLQAKLRVVIWQKEQNQETKDVREIVCWMGGIMIRV